jgi:hypothetical protein
VRRREKSLSRFPFKAASESRETHLQFLPRKIHVTVRPGATRAPAHGREATRVCHLRCVLHAKEQPEQPRENTFRHQAIHV